jgi:ATP/maltotriose-dependent transcriptional regulator MalT
VAPAGFGKTTIAKAIAEEHGPYVICDVAGVANVQTFAQQLIPAVSQLAPERADSLANDLFRHLQPGATNAQLAGFVLDVWSSMDDRNACIFDNLEALTEQPDSLDLLVRLIKTAQRRLLILCARPPFALLNSRLIPPNEHLR